MPARLACASNVDSYGRIKQSIIPDQRTERTASKSASGAELEEGLLKLLFSWLLLAFCLAILESVAISVCSYCIELTEGSPFELFAKQHEELGSGGGVDGFQLLELKT